MQFAKLTDKFLFDNKREVLRLYLYSKFLQNKIRPYEHDMDILIELYLFGGYSNSEEQLRFISLCLENKYKTSAQSVRNTLSKYTNLKVLNKPKNRVLSFNPSFIPNMKCEKLWIEYTISHKN